LPVPRHWLKILVTVFVTPNVPDRAQISHLATRAANVIVCRTERAILFKTKQTSVKISALGKALLFKPVTTAV
jgi:hypothetical protein